MLSLDQAAEMFKDPIDDLGESDLDMLKKYAIMKKKVKTMTEQLNSAKQQLAEMMDNALAVMDAGGISKIAVEDRTLSPSSRTWFYVKAAEKEKAYDWLKTNGFEELVQPTVNVTSLSAQLKEYEEQGHDIPTDLFDKQIKRQLGVTK